MEYEWKGCEAKEYWVQLPRYTQRFLLRPVNKILEHFNSLKLMQIWRLGCSFPNCKRPKGLF